MKRWILPTLLVVTTAAAQDEPEVRRAEPVNPVPEVRRAAPVTEVDAGAPPAMDEADGTEALRVAPITNITGDPVKQAFAEANAFYSQKMYDLAVPKYQEFLGMSPRSLDRQAGLFRIGESFRALQRQADAQTAYRQLLSEYNSGEFVGPAAYRLGEMQYSAKDFDGAAAAFRLASAHVRQPELRMASKFFEGRSLEGAGRRVEALSAYREVAAQREDNPYRERAMFDLADADARAGLTDSAFRQWRKLAESAQSPVVRASSAVKAGLLAIDQRDFDVARSLLEAGASNRELAEWWATAQVGLVRLDYEAESYEAAAGRAAEVLPVLSDDKRPDVLLLAANAHRQLGQQAEALELYDKLASGYPGSRAAREAGFHRLVSLVAQKDERALGQIEAFLLSSPDEESRAKAELLKAELLFAQDRFAEAEELYRKAATARGTEKYRADALYKLAWCQLQQKKYDDTVQSLTRFLLQFPRHPMASSAFAQRALAQLETGDQVAALSDFEAIIDRHRAAPEREDAMLQRALLLGNMKRTAEMAAAFERLLAEYPESKAAAQAHFWIGYTASDAKKYRDSIGPLRKAREIDPEKYGERATLRLLLSYYYLEDREAAGREARALGAEKTPAEVRSWLGLTSLEAGDNKTAIEFLEPLAAAPDATEELRMSLAQAQVNAGELAAARETLEKLLASLHEPKAKARAHLLLSGALLGLDMGEESKSHAEEALRLQPEGRLNAEARLANGRALLVQGRHDDAARAFMAVALLYDEKDLSPQALLLAEDAYQRASNPEDAARAREELERRYPDFKTPPAS